MYVCMYLYDTFHGIHSRIYRRNGCLREEERSETTTGRRLIVGDTRAAVKDDMETDRETLRPVTLDIVFWILMAFTGVSG